MGDSIEGGRYRVGDRFVDANGKELDSVAGAGAVAETPADTYPYADLLRAGGIMDSDAARTANYEELIAVDGIGPAKAKEIQAHFGNG